MKPRGIAALLAASIALFPATLQAEESPFSSLVPVAKLPAWITAAAFSADGKRLAVCAQVADGPGAVAVLSVPDLAVLAELPGSPEQVHSLAFGGAAGEWIAAGSRRNLVIVWDARGGDPKRILTLGQIGMNVGVAFLPNPRALYLEGAWLKGQIRDWTQPDAPDPPPATQQAIAIGSWALSPPGMQMFVAHADADGIVVDRLTDGRRVSRAEGVDCLERIASVSVSRDGTRFGGIVGSRIAVFETTTGKCLWQAKVAAGPASLAVFSDDLSCAAVSPGTISAGGQSLAVWDLAAGKPLHSVSTDCPRITGMARSVDGRHLFVHGYDGAVLLGKVE